MTPLKVVGAAVAVIGACLALAAIDDVVTARVVAIACVALALWLFEVVPAFVPTFLIVAALPMSLGTLSGGAFTLRATLESAADPVLALFFGGFVLAAAARRHGLDTLAAGAVVRASRGNRRWLIVLLTATSAFLSMWMSNIAAAAMLLQVVRPLVDAEDRGSGFRRALLLAICFGANFGGMATPIGSGPNAIAIAQVPGGIAFAHWIAFALPLTLALLVVALGIILVVCRVSGTFTAPPRAPEQGHRDDAPTRIGAVSFVFAACVLAWLTEPVHGVPAAVVALAATSVLFLTGLVGERELKELDWSTLLLIAGGIVLGHSLEAAGLLARAAELASAVDPRVTLGLFVLGAALLSSLMSNTATATLLVPLALAAAPSPSTAVLVAIGCSLGAPFAISTPPNAMAFGAGARASDLLKVGLPLLLLGSAVVVATGPAMLRFFGIP